MVVDLLALARPRQWTKNLAVFAAVLFSGELTQVRAVVLASLAFVAFCLVTGGLYALNDVRDAQRDREHPLKRERPVASGRVAPGVARVFGYVLIGAGLALSLWIGQAFIALVALYLVLQLSYGIWLKHIAIVDMLVIAAGFVIRAVAGAAAIALPVSPWLALCTGLLALFLAAAKRRHELLVLGDRSVMHRPVLEEYSSELLDSFMVTLSAATITTYALYTFFEQRGPANTMMLTIPFVIYGVLRYQSLVLSSDVGGKPEDVLLGDKPIMLDIALWVAACVVILYIAPLYVAN